MTFAIYSDPDLAAIRAFGVLDEANSIARPAVFVVTREGKIGYRHVGERASDTASLDAVFAALEKLQPAKE